MGRGMMLAAAAAVVLGMGVSGAQAASVDEIITARQACMKANGKMMGALAAIVKGEKDYSADAVHEALATDEKACADWANWWGPDTAKGDKVETYAKPEIWTDMKGFEAAGGAFVEKDKAVAATTSLDELKPAVMALGGACKGCHEKFRRPKE
ncbi:c-type cytochrome [Aestuariivirga sp.]|uniref:c-type cytochrome n=1 Tax=Aestuariivirga sp. TaxID=2650926 RepID=UPI0039E363A5